MDYYLDNWYGFYDDHQIGFSDTNIRRGYFGNAGRYMHARYTPDGIRIDKERVWDDDIDYHHKYIVDTSGKLPHILLVLDTGDDNNIIQSFVYANDQVLMQRDGSMYNAGTRRYFYLHDRLGSVRMVIDPNAAVQNHYSFDPWGNIFDNEIEENVSNPYRFAGYFWDDETGLAYCNARIYDPVIGRFTSRDPVCGLFNEPFTLHAYLYCPNNPINMTDHLCLLPSSVLTILLTVSRYLSITNHQNHA